jgi:hypothetical protein
MKTALPMARPTSWGPRITQIIEHLEADFPLEHYDRGEVEKLFQISTSQAKGLMNRVGRGGLGLTVSRSSLLDYVRNCAEAHQARRFAGQLASMSREAAARKVRIPVRPGDEWIRFRELDSVEIREEPPCQGSPRRSLTVVFTDMEDLLRQLMLLSKAAMNEP